MATLLPTDPNAYTTILGGWSWNGIQPSTNPVTLPAPAPVIVTFSFPTTLPVFDQNIPGFTGPNTNGSFSAFTPAEQTEALGALNQWASASGIVFIQVAPGQGDINFSNIDFQKLASPSSDAGVGYNPGGSWNSYSYPYFTTDQTYGGSVFMNSEYLNNSNPTDPVSLETLLHEIGHAIGFKHPDELGQNGVNENILSTNGSGLTVMSTVNDSSTPDSEATLYPLDQQADAALYGPAGTGGVYTTSVGSATNPIVNSVSSWYWDAATQTLTQTGNNNATDVIHGTSVNDVIQAGTGTDYLFGLNGNNVLTGGTLSSSVDYLYGGPDTDTLNGGAGTNYLYAGTGTETLNGGIGTNTFYDGVYAGFGGGGTGATSIHAEGATDYFYVGSTTTQITETNAASVAMLYSTVSYMLPTNVNTLHLYGSAQNPDGAGLTGTANNDANVTMYAAAGGDTLIAGSGHDYISGGIGNDTIVAGGGYDQLFGGGGANTFVFNSVADNNPSTYIGDFVEGTDKIDLTGIAQSLHSPLTFIGNTLTPVAFAANDPGQVQTYVSGNEALVEVDTTTGTAATLTIQVYDNGGTANGVALQASDLEMACYCAGTRILTDHGEVAVEDLSIGDRVLTRGGAARPIKWIGQRSYADRFAQGHPKIMPVCFKAGSLAEGVPKRDLWVSPNHAMYLDGLLIQAADLVNGDTVVQARSGDTVRYFHIELASHDVVLAEGAWSETFIDDDSRMMFHNADDYFRRFPEQPADPPLYCAPRVSEGFELEAIRQRIKRHPGRRQAAAASR